MHTSEPESPGGQSPDPVAQGGPAAPCEPAQHRIIDHLAAHLSSDPTFSTAISRQDGHLQAILDSALDCIIAMDGQGRVVEFNPAAERTFGYLRGEVEGLLLADLIIPARLRAAHREGLKRYLATGEGRVLDRRSEVTGMRADGSELQVELTISRVQMPGAVLFLAYLRDLSERDRAEAARRASERSFRSLFDDNPQPMFLLDRRTFSYLAVNRAALALYGYTRDEFLRLRQTQLRVDDEHAQLWKDRGALARGVATHFVNTRHRTKSGTILDVEIDVVHADFEGKATFLTVINNVTDRMRLQRELEHQAFHDALTGLPNRALFTNRVGHALARGARQERSVAVLFLDIDNFKTVNDSLGHAAGDELLRTVAARLRQPLRAGDTAARFGGDEFAVLLESITDPRQVARICLRIAALLREPVVIEGTSIAAQVSIGVAYGTDAGGVEQLLGNADLAMYQAKARGKGCFQLYEPEMHQEVAQRLQMESDLRVALEHGELELHYQPVLDLAGLRAVGVEGLARWHHPQRGLIPPLEFIALAEETGLICLLGRWVLNAACLQVKTWQREIPGMQDLNAAVNVSPRQLEDPGLVDDVRLALAASGLSPEKLVLEVTESVAMRDIAAACLRLHQLKGLGVKIAIDDFGTGHSSLAHLRRFPVDIVKVDQAFVDRIEEEPEAFELLHAVVRMAQSLGIDVVVEGVEFAEQASIIGGLVPVYVQGFLYSRPREASSMTWFLRDHAG